MFASWSSGSGNSRIGCCGAFVLLPLAFVSMSGGLGTNNMALLLVGLAVFAGLLLLPYLRRLWAMNSSKRKNDTLYGNRRKNDTLYADEKPKRHAARTIRTEDGEILDVIEADDTDGMRGRGP